MLYYIFIENERVIDQTIRVMDVDINVWYEAFQKKKLEVLKRFALEVNNNWEEVNDENKELIIEIAYEFQLLSLQTNFIIPFLQEESIDLQERGINRLPVGLFSLPKMKFLNIACNHFKEIDVTIKNLPNLKTLNLSHNKIEAIPEHLSEVKKLETLLLKNNTIKQVEQKLQFPPKIKYIDLEANRIHEFSCSLETNYRLEFLSLANNLLVELPDFFLENVHTLKHLDLSENALLRLSKKVIKNIGRQKGLKNLIVDSDSISKKELLGLKEVLNKCKIVVYDY